jgi:hypothetical protein
MIDLIYTNPCFQHPLGKIECIIPHDLLNVNFPVTFKVFNRVNGEVRWGSNELFPGFYAFCVEPDNSYVEIFDSKGNVVSRWEWDLFLHGDECHVDFMEWALKNKGANGICVGTHDGTTGEWVEPLRAGLVEAYLVEASVPQYKKLVDNYRGVSGFYPILSLITTNGEECIFFEGGPGERNSILSEYPGVNSVPTLKKSKSLTDLICEVGLSRTLDWLHLDVEGIDVDLILSLDEDKINLPEIIIFESVGISEEKKKKALDWFTKKGYSYKDCNWNTIAIRKNKHDVTK